MTQQDIVRLSAETGISLGAVRRWAKGLKVQTATRLTLDGAAKVLGIDTDDTQPKAEQQ